MALLLRMLAAVFPFCFLGFAVSRSSSISDLKSKISGVEELLEEFRQQLRGGEDATVDSCLGDYDAVGERIIRARDSIELGATFLLAPEPLYSWRDCLHACCRESHCTLAVVQEDVKRSGDRISCYLFNCTYRGKNVCLFAAQEGFTSYSRAANSTQGLGHLPAAASSARRPGQEENEAPEADEPPRSDAGQDVVIQLPTDWAVLDGRDSVDDHGINRYEWTLVKGDTAISMKVTHPGLLKISGLQEGVYTFQMTVTDMAGQKSSDNVSVTVLPPKHQAEVCTGHCSNYQFRCDDGCCIDITYTCDGKQHCPDRSDEDFCPNFDSSRKSVSHPTHMIGPQWSREETLDGSVSVSQNGLRKTIEDIVQPQDRTKTAPPQSNSEQKTSVRSNVKVSLW